MAWSKLVIAIGIIGVACCIVGGCLIKIFDVVIHNQIDDQVSLQEGSEAYDVWKEIPVPIYMQYWFFNVENPYNVSQGAKPVLRQVGPYTYREYREKENITFNSNNTVSYQQQKTYVFQPNMSVGNDSDVVTSLNMPLITVATFIKHQPDLVKILASLFFLLLDEPLFVNRTVNEYLWGYEDRLLKDIHFFLPSLVPDGTFGYFYGPASGNLSFDGVYNVFTGVGNPEQVALIDNWNFASNLQFWRSEYCNQINGTDGSVFAPSVDKTSTLRVFSTDICRSLYLLYEQEITYKDIALLRFTAPDELFLNASVNPDNQCYCMPCLGTGLLNVSVCKQGAPVVLSAPHFYQGDPKFANAVEGLHPVKSEHETFSDVEPNTGMVMRLARRMQVNVFVEHVELIVQTDKLKPTFFPVLWLNESSAADDASVEKFRKQVQTPMLILTVVQYFVIALGALLVVIFIVLFMFSYRKATDEEKEPLLPPVRSN